MTYSITKPDAGPSPALDVGQIRTNFSTYNTAFSVNHTAMNSPKQGDHESVVFLRQLVDPFVENGVTIYCKDATSKAGTQPQLFVKNTQFLPNNIPNSPMQLTYNSVNTAGPVYQSFLPGGYLIYFGTTNNIAVNINLSPAPTRILMAQAFPNLFVGSGASITNAATQIISTSSFKINSTAAGGTPFTWLAIALA